ncbi:IclR family transcriptional regulator, partial [Pseudomonas aeruginosa]
IAAGHIDPERIEGLVSRVRSSADELSYLLDYRADGQDNVTPIFRSRPHETV